LNNDPPIRKKPVKAALLRMIEFGGPLPPHAADDQQSSFDATCRKLRRFLEETTP
jgi:hypothetical protein